MDLEEIIKHSYTYQVFSICVCFTLVFRTQISYSRYWESCTELHKAASAMLDVTVQSLSFDAAGKHTPELDADRRRFCRRLMHQVCATIGYWHRQTPNTHTH